MNEKLAILPFFAVIGCSSFVYFAHISTSVEKILPWYIVGQLFFCSYHFPSLRLFFPFNSHDQKHWILQFHFLFGRFNQFVLFRNNFELQIWAQFGFASFFENHCIFGLSFCDSLTSPLKRSNNLKKKNEGLFRWFLLIGREMAEKDREREVRMSERERERVCVRERNWLCV